MEFQRPLRLSGFDERRRQIHGNATQIRLGVEHHTRFTTRQRGTGVSPQSGGVIKGAVGGLVHGPRQPVIQPRAIATTPASEHDVVRRAGNVYHHRLLVKACANAFCFDAARIVIADVAGCTG